MAPVVLLSRQSRRRVTVDVSHNQHRNVLIFTTDGRYPVSFVKSSGVITVVFPWETICSNILPNSTSLWFCKYKTMCCISNTRCWTNHKLHRTLLLVTLINLTSVGKYFMWRKCFQTNHQRYRKWETGGGCSGTTVQSFWLLMENGDAVGEGRKI